MHDTAYELGAQFFKHYWKDSYSDVLDLGAMNVNGSLRDFCPAEAKYIGADLGPGKGVDVVITDPTALPFPDESFDVIVSSSCFEHDSFFWLTFMEFVRLLKKGGVIYINAPSNGAFHRYPLDCWRFYPDAAVALTKWARKMGSSLDLVESFIAGRKADIWNDCIMVFGKDCAIGPAGYLHTALPYPAWNVHTNAEGVMAEETLQSQDMMLIQNLQQRNAAISTQAGELLGSLVRSRSPVDDTQICATCGHSNFGHLDVLDPRLIEDWQLNTSEANYINRQQGSFCRVCGANMRSQVLARAIASFLGRTEPLIQVINALRPPHRVLEINDAGTLGPILTCMPNHLLATYPEVDMMALPYETGSFDLVVHSDTLEHVPDPIAALAECLRVLKPGGACVFTVPMVVDRMSRDRAGLSKSYHGAYDNAPEDYVVQTEFGADAWTYASRAGFSRVTMDTLDYPTSVAITAWKGGA